MHMAAEVVAALPSNSSCDELEETIPESMRTMRDVKCESVASKKAHYFSNGGKTLPCA